MNRGIVAIRKHVSLVGPLGNPLLQIQGRTFGASSQQPHAVDAREFVDAYQIATDEWRELEALVHWELRDCRSADELFDTPLNTARHCLEALQDELETQRLRKPYAEVDSELEVGQGICLVKRFSGSSVYSDGVYAGELITDTSSALFRFDPIDAAREAPLFAVEGPRNKWSQRFLLRQAKLRAAWLARNLSYFLTPALEANLSGKVLRLNGLPVAELCPVQTGISWMRRALLAPHALRFLPFSAGALLDRQFESTCGVAEVKFAAQPNGFSLISPQHLKSIGDRFVQSTLRASWDTQSTRWHAQLRIGAYEIELTRSEPSLPRITRG